MKKLLAIVLSVMLVLGCAAMAESAPDITGTWYGSMVGMVLQLDLNADNTYAMTMMGEAIGEGSWELEGEAMYLDRGSEAETVFAVTADSLSASDEGMGMEVTFTREPIEQFVAPEKVAVDDITAFNGTWSGTMVSIPEMGMSLDMSAAKEELGEMLGMQDTSLVITDGSAVVFGGDTIAFEFTDGHLYLGAGDEEVDLSMSIDMNEDGTIVMEMFGMQFFFEKAAE